jgi:AbiV family abortive infection protein
MALAAPDQKDDLKPAIQAAIENAARLLDDAREFMDLQRYPTACALSILSQEEFAKAFLLHLVEVGAFPWNGDVRAALRDHKCKQLLGMLMDYIAADFEEIMAEMSSGKKPGLPSLIADAMNIIRHEKIPKDGYWAWLDDSDPPCDPDARKTADGRLDTHKQSCLYVGIGKTGKVTTTPSSVTIATAAVEFEKATRLNYSFTHSSRMGSSSLRYDMVLETFKVLFGIVTIDEYNKNWWA